ncbi:hypothetical protein AB4876_10220 [Zhongshania guokunii]|uniref:Integrase n=1 Tax=Zhongshania guokunii TaxID=641783 RepID=A0ABV3U5Y6_9GAMM
MAGIRAISGSSRRGRPGAKLATSKSREIADQHEQPLLALVLQYATAEGEVVQLPFKGSLAPGRESIIQPLLDAQSILLNRKSKGYGEKTLRAIAWFAEFLDYLDAQGNGLHGIVDIDPFTGAAYERWLQMWRSGKTENGKIYRTLERSLQLLRSDATFNSRPDIGNEPIKWPRGPRHLETSLESLDNLTYTGLIRACQKDINDFRKIFDSSARLEDTAEIIVDADPCLENLAWFVIDECNGNYPLASKRKDPESVESARRASYLSNALRKWHGMSVVSFRELLDTDEGRRLASLGRMPKNRRVYSNNTHIEVQNGLVLASIIKTIRVLYPGWPLLWEARKAMELFGHNSASSRYSGHLGRSVMRYSSPLTGMGGVSGILDGIYPQTHVIWSIFIWCRIQSGWNSETMISIDFDDESIFDCPLDPENYALIIGTKIRPAPKQLIHRSNKHDRYGVYSVLKWLKKIAEPIRFETGSACPWQFVRQCNVWEALGFFGSLRTRPSAHKPVRAFFKRHEIFNSAGVRVTSINLEQLRTTYEDARAAKWDGNLRAISMDMSHASEETTDRHYDSNTASLTRKDETIAAIQREVVEHVRYFQGTHIDGQSRSNLAQALPLSTASMKRMKEQMGSNTTDEEVYRVISPDAETYLAVCRNPKKPTWRGHENYVPSGEDCGYFNGCATCRQVVIFDEALPYIAARVLKLDELRSLFSLLQWEGSFGEEYTAWSELLGTWTNRQRVLDAEALAKTGEILIPVVMVR